MALILNVTLASRAPARMEHARNLEIFELYNGVDQLIRRLRNRYNSDDDHPSGGLAGWGGLETWLKSHRNKLVNNLAIDLKQINVLGLGEDAQVCINETKEYVSWIAHVTLTDLVRCRKDSWVGSWFWQFPTLAELTEVDSADIMLERRTQQLDHRDCQVIRVVQNKESTSLRTWLDQLWMELGELQPALISLTQEPYLETPLPDRERVLSELELYGNGKGNRTPLNVLLMSYVLTSHARGGWRLAIQCGQILGLRELISGLVRDLVEGVKRTAITFILCVALVFGILLVFGQIGFDDEWRVVIGSASSQSSSTSSTALGIVILLISAYLLSPFSSIRGKTFRSFVDVTLVIVLPLFISLLVEIAFGNRNPPRWIGVVVGALFALAIIDQIHRRNPAP